MLPCCVALKNRRCESSRGTSPYGGLTVLKFETRKKYRKRLVVSTVLTRVEDSDRVNQGNGDEDATTSETQDKETNQPLPEFGQYLYFLFCPTLVYRDQYPM